MVGSSTLGMGRLGMLRGSSQVTWIPGAPALLEGHYFRHLSLDPT